MLACRTPPCEQPATPVHVTDPLACRPGTSEHEAARERFDALDRRIEALQLDDPVGPIELELGELRASRCFERSVEHDERFSFESGGALREWWERGGRSWLGSYLHLPAPGDAIVLPPTPRGVLYPGRVQGTPLARLVCPHEPPRTGTLRLGARTTLAASLAPEQCGYETMVWLNNAHQAHEYWALWSGDWQVPAIAGRHYSINADGDMLRANPVGDGCAHAIEHDLLPSYRRWRACVEAERGRMSLLPYGQFRQPEHGWLIVEFRSFGVDTGCSGYTAYHLDTGAAHWGKRCEDGSDERHSGTVSAERVREALLISMLVDYAVAGAPFADAVRTPDGMPIIWPEGARPLRWRQRPLVRVDHETSVYYRWWDGELIAEGTVYGPYHGTGADAHARSLHFDLAGSQREGPTPTELPDELWASFAREPNPDPVD